MKIFDSMLLVIGAAGAIAWTVIASKDGFKQNNAMIVARSIDIAATIDGEVENEQLEVGTPLRKNDLMVKIRNTRIDRSREIELKTRLAFLKAEIVNIQHEQAGLRKMLAQFEKNSSNYANWLLHDLRLKKQIKQQQWRRNKRNCGRRKSSRRLHWSRTNRSA